jgi:hypothetical protein
VTALIVLALVASFAALAIAYRDHRHVVAAVRRLRESRRRLDDAAEHYAAARDALERATVQRRGYGR